MTKLYSPAGWKGAAFAKRNCEAVRQWFVTHPGGTQTECAADLGLSVMAVNRHVKTLRREWQKS